LEVSTNKIKIIGPLAISNLNKDTINLTLSQNTKSVGTGTKENTQSTCDSKVAEKFASPFWYSHLFKVPSRLPVKR
jgi:hypothetical protein